METQIRLQQETSEKLRGIRKQHGALTFGSVEPMPVVENGELVGILTVSDMLGLLHELLGSRAKGTVG